MQRHRDLVAAMCRATHGAAIVALLLACASGEALGACRFNAGSTTGAVAFPVLDPVTAPNVASAIQLRVRCTPASDFTVAVWSWNSANGGATIGRLAGGTPPYAPGIPYAPSISVARQGASGTLTLTLQIAGASYANANAGAYADVLTLSVTP